MLNEFSEFFINIKKKSIDYKNFNKFLNKLDELELKSTKFELSLNCMINEKYVLDMIKKDKNIEDIIKFVYYIIHCYLIKKNDMELYGKKEMNDYKANNTKYIIYKTDTQEKLNIFLIFLRIFYRVDLSNTNYLGIDLEFNTKVAALIQICFEGFKIPDDNMIYSFIFIFDPNQLKENDKNCLIKNYLINNKYYKILHGAESLDIPYLFETLLQNNKGYIKQFTKNYIDTRYLCEYYNRENLGNEKKCKIYYALLNLGIINQEHFNKLLKNQEEMGPIYEIKININNIDQKLLKYTLYDVIFLKSFFFKFIYNKDNTKNKIYLSVIPEITQFILLEKKNITNYFLKYKPDIDKRNNNYTFIGKQFFKLIDIFKKIVEAIALSKINLKYLLDINYYRKFLFYLIKLITYNYVIDKYTVYSAKNRKVIKLIDLNKVNIDINNAGYNNINILINNLENNIRKNFDLFILK
jgi:hypothetical protein